MVDTAHPVKYHSTTDNKPLLREPSIDLETVEGRLETFKNWPNREIEPKRLADAGFYYVGRYDIVRCPFCCIEGFKWMANDNPMEDHKRWSQAHRRRCRFVSQEQPQNEEETEDETSANGRDTCGKYGVEIIPNSVPEDEVNLQKWGVTKVKGHAHPDYKVVSTRVSSFKEWPKSMKQKPEDLADAGFFYTGVGDQTLCFHCGGGLKDWEENDEPWEQHAMWFPKCNYLLMKKGVEYVNRLKQTEENGAAACGTEAASASTSTSTNSTITSDVASDLKSVTSANASEESDKDQTKCKICYKNELGVVFLPCGHIVACVDCATALSRCAVCRKPLEATVRAFLS